MSCYKSPPRKYRNSRRCRWLSTSLKPKKRDCCSKPAPSIPLPLFELYVTTPRTPKDRLQMLRTAFARTLTDPEFVAEAKKATLDINPLNGDEVKKIVDDLFKLGPAVKNKLAGILAAK